MNRNKIVSSKLYIYIVLIGVIFLYFFAPYKMIASISTNVVIGMLLIFFALQEGQMKRKRMILALFVVSYMLFVTLCASITIPYAKEIDLGVFLIIVSICAYCSNEFSFPKMEGVYIIIAILDIFVILWGLCFIFKINAITSWTSSVYGMSGDGFFYRSILLGKPVLSLRFHGQASYAYINLFMLNYLMLLQDKSKKNCTKIMTISMFIFILYAVCLQSNAGYAIAVLMGVLLTWYYFKIYGVKAFLMWVPIIVVAIYILASNDIISYALEHVLTGKNNGFLGRYSGLYAGNFEMISNYFATGLYSISDYTIKADSGFMVALTRGNVIFVVSYYYLIWSFLKRNFNKREAVLIATIFLIYEFAYTFLIGRYNGLYWLVAYKICLNSKNTL